MSRLFHAIVAVGIALGTAACGAAADEDASPSDTADQLVASEAAHGAPDPFCDAAWPTTKGGRPLSHETAVASAPACIDEHHECDPDKITGCVDNAGPGRCTTIFYSVCKHGRWECNSATGKMPHEWCPH